MHWFHYYISLTRLTMAHQILQRPPTINHFRINCARDRLAVTAASAVCMEIYDLRIQQFLLDIYALAACAPHSTAFPRARSAENLSLFHNKSSAIAEPRTWKTQ